MAGLSASDLDLMSWVPPHGCLLQHRLGAKKAVAFDISAACPGFIYRLTIAQKFMQDGSHQQALVVGEEILSHRIDFEDRATCLLFGDGAGAVILGPSQERKRGRFIPHQANIRIMEDCGPAGGDSAGKGDQNRP